MTQGQGAGKTSQPQVTMGRDPALGQWSPRASPLGGVAGLWGLGPHSRRAPEINETVARHLKPRTAFKERKTRPPLFGGHALPTDWGHGQNKLSRHPTGREGTQCPRRKGKKAGHLSLSLCFLLGSGGVCEGEDSCLPRSPQKVRLCQWPGACSARLQEERPARGEGVAGCS